MIISAPTALYAAVLPAEISDGTPVTWTISSQNPPRSTETLFQLLRSEQLRRLPGLVYDDKERRRALGELIFRVASGAQKTVDDGKKTFEVGQILEFTDIQPPSNIDILNVPSIVDLQQNTNVLDLSSLGLTEDQIALLTDKAEDQFKAKLTELNNIVSGIKGKQADIASNQKLVNETRKARDAAAVVFADSTDLTSGNIIIDQLNQKETSLLAERDTLIADLNLLTVQANEIYNEILDVREVIR